MVAASESYNAILLTLARMSY